MQNLLTLASLAASASAVSLTTATTTSTSEALPDYNISPDEYFYDKWVTLTDAMRAKGFTETYFTTDDQVKKNWIDGIGQEVYKKDLNPKDGLLQRDEIIAICQAKNLTVTEAESFADNALDEYDADSVGKLAYHEFMRAWWLLKKGVDEPWTVWPTGEKTGQRVVTAMLYGDITSLTELVRSLGFTTTHDDLAEDDPIRVMIDGWKQKIGQATMDGLLDQTEVASAVDGVFDQDFVDFAMSKDGDGDGRLMYHEFMQAVRAEETGVDEPWTIWPGTGVARRFHEAMIKLIPKPSTPATPPLGDAPTCELTDSLRQIGYTSTYDELITYEKLELTNLIQAADQSDIDGDGLLSKSELSSFIPEVFLHGDGPVPSATELMSLFGFDDDDKLNFRHLIEAHNYYRPADLRRVWPCAENLPMRFRAIPEVGGEIDNPIHCRS